MKWTSQAELIKQLSDRQLITQLYLTQLILIIFTFISSLFLFSSIFDLKMLFTWDLTEVVKYGVSASIVVLAIDLILMYTLPKKYYDDGGINEKVFRNTSVFEIFLISLLVAFSEEIFFRGVIHTSFGYLIGSISFALVHIRYLTKPVLLISVLFISFYIGWMYELTQNLWVTIVAHFLIDFVLGVMIRLKIMR